MEKFKEKKISVHLGEEFNQVLSSAEEALYSPQSFGKMQEDYESVTVGIIIMGAYEKRTFFGRQIQKIRNWFR